MGYLCTHEVGKIVSSCLLVVSLSTQLHRYKSSANKLECVTRPHPDAFEGFYSALLQTKVISNGVIFETTNYDESFQYHWSYTPLVNDMQAQLVLASS